MALPVANLGTPSPRASAPVAATGDVGSNQGPRTPLERFVGVIPRLLRVPIAIVTVVRTDGQHVLASVGLTHAGITPGSQSPSDVFCRRVIEHAAPLMVADARLDVTVRLDPCVTERGVIGYLGVPVRTSSGMVVGSLCAVDRVPRAWTADDLDVLTDLAAGIEAEMLRQATGDAPDVASGRYGDLLDRTTELVCTADPAGVITYVNNAWCQAFGYSRQEACGMRAIDLVAGEHRAAYADAGRRLHEGERIEALEVVALGAGGRRVVCRGSAMPIMVTTADGGAHCIGSQAVYQDVTIQRRLEASRARLVATLEATSDFVGIASSEGRIEYINRSGRRLVGLSDSEDVGALTAESFHPAATLALLATEGFPSALRDGEWRGEGELRHTDGTCIPVAISMTAHPALSDDAPGFFAAMMRDLRVERAARAALTQSETQLRAMFTNAAVGVSLVGSDGTILRTNAAFDAMLGYETGTLCGRRAPDLSPAAEAEVTRDAVRALRAGEIESVSVEKRFIHASGDIRVLALTLSLVPLEDGSSAVLGLTTDVTDRLDAERALEKEREFLAATLESLSDGVVACDEHGTLVLFNSATRALHGAEQLPLGPDQWAGTYDLFSADGQTPMSVDEIPLYRALTQGVVKDAEMVIAPASGARRSIVASGKALLGPDGRVTGAVVAMRDVSAEREAERALREREAQLATIYNHSSDVMILLSVERDPRGGIAEYRCESANEPMLSVKGVGAEAYVGRTLRELVDPDGYADLRARCDDAVRTGQKQQFEVHARLPNGAMTYETTVTPIRNASGRCTQVLCSGRDITARREAEAALKRSEAAFRTMLQTVRSVAVTLDSDGNVTFANEALLTLTGWTRDEVIATDWFAKFTAEPEMMRLLFQCVIAGKELVPHYENELVTRDGRRRLIVWDNTLLRNGDGEIVGTASIGQDVTDQRALQARLAALSEQDELTGLLNRRGFSKRVEQGLRQVRRSGRHDALLYLDLDHFKPINDTFGHAAGDQALRDMSTLLQETVRDTDVAGRLGGDEFAVYASHLESAEAIDILVRRLQEAVALHNAEETLNGRPFTLEFSVGVAAVQQGDTEAELFARADAALYARKKARA